MSGSNWQPKSQIFNVQNQESASGGRWGSSAEAGGSGSTLQGARKHTLSAQLNKLCEIIKHDHLLLVSITSKSKLSEEDARSARAASAPIGWADGDVRPSELADWLIRSALTIEGEIMFKISWTCGFFFTGQRRIMMMFEWASLAVMWKVTVN